MVKPTKKMRSPPRLPVNFEKRIIELEFKIEKGQAGQEQIHELVDMYNKASSHYDKVKDKDQAEIYRQKIQMLFIKPAVMMILTGGQVPQPITGQKNKEKPTEKDTELPSNEQTKPNNP